VATVSEKVRDYVTQSPEWKYLASRTRRIWAGPSAAQVERTLVESKWTPRRSGNVSFWIPLGLIVAGFVGSLVITASAPLWRLAVPSWRLTVPGIGHPGSAAASSFWFVTGMSLLALSWLGLIYVAARFETKKAIVTVALALVVWAIPVSLGPPLLSNDVYSYVAQGEMASRGIDPSTTGPISLGRGDFTSGADPYWRPSPAPYGPVAVATARSAVELSGHNAPAAINIYRVFVWIGIAVAAVGIGFIAAANGLSPAVAIAIGLANPVVIVHLIGGAHNDALMLGLLAAGLALAQRGFKKWGVALIIAATAVKIPAAIALLYLGWCWNDRGDFKERLRTTATVLATAFLSLVVASWLVGLGPGWLTALRSTGKVNDTYSPTTKIGFSISEILDTIGIRIDGQSLAGGVRSLGLLLTAVVVLIMLRRSPLVGFIKATAVVLVAYVILGPVIWPWYLPTGFALLAACGLGRYRPSYFVVCIAVSFFVWPTSSISLSSTTSYPHLRGLGVVLLVAGLAFGAQKFANRLDRHGTDASYVDSRSLAESQK
jgi:hypothetical protein